MPTPILLVAVNARYQHTSFALRYLRANLGQLEESCALLELTLEDRPVDALEKILQHDPQIVGLSVYIWNATACLEIARLLKRVAPQVTLVVGGPEVTYEYEQQELFQICDYLVTHEGEVAFRELCRSLLDGQPPQAKIQPGGQPDLQNLQLPYRLYSDHDLQHRVVYVEASRGCPFRCEFCLSSLDRGVRYFPLDALLKELQGLLDRGARQFKFIDRTFNLRLEVSQQLLQFFLERYEEGLFVHFEMVPDRFPEELRQLVARFPAGAIQFEIGIQTFDEEVQKRISRRQDVAKLEENLQFLRQNTGVHIHADLIVGLPGETLEQFARGFDRLVGLNPQEIQVGILKRLRGTPILRHDDAFSMVYSPSPPYEILTTAALPFTTMMSLKRFARMWDVVANRGRFPRSLPLLLKAQPFRNFMNFTQWALSRLGGTREMPHQRLTELLFDYLVEVENLEVVRVSQAIVADYTEGDRRHPPGFLYSRPEVPRELLRSKKAPPPSSGPPALPRRQARHLSGEPDRSLALGPSL